MVKKKRKLSKYNMHMKRQMKAGKTFTQAVRAWKGGRTLKTRKRAVKRRAVTMPRRRSRARRVYSRAKRAYSSPNRLMRGMMPVGGMFGKALAGAGVASLQESLPQVIPYQGVAAGFIVGGIPGAAGAFAKQFIAGGGLGQITGGTTVGGSY